MPAIAMVLAWAGWSVMSWGYNLIRGYDVTFTDWVNPLHPYDGPWPPPTIPDTTVLPSGVGKEEGGTGNYQPPKKGKGKGKGGTPASTTSSTGSGGPGPSVA